MLYSCGKVQPEPECRDDRVRDGGCGFPGGDRPIDWTQAHHLQHRTQDGETNLENVYLLRGFHRLTHEGGWRLVREYGDSLLAIPPNGRLHQPQPAARST
ncbi:MAG: hypothetical protein E6J00_13460 [Chloroflexi bacterium]|nr:MAG: hypothetical protein E6J00_13460 [Chloroflexota bacterium]